MEQNKPYIYQLLQIRILLALGRTYQSTDIHQSSLNELEKVILDTDLKAGHGDEKGVITELPIGKQAL